MELEFDKYSLPLHYPKEHEIYAFAEFLTKQDDMSSATCAPADDVSFFELSLKRQWENALSLYIYDYDFMVSNRLLSKILSIKILYAKFPSRIRR